MMKAILISIFVLASMPLASMAQDDIYFVPRKTEPKIDVKRASQGAENGYYLTTKVSDLSDSTRTSLNGAWVGDYADGQQGEYTERLARFHSPRVGVVVTSPYYWDITYGPYSWYSPYYYSRWYDPWYDPYYYGVSWYSPYYYGGYYSPYYYGGYYSPYYYGGFHYSYYWPHYHGGWGGRPLANHPLAYRRRDNDGMGGVSHPRTGRNSGMGTRLNPLQRSTSSSGNYRNNGNRFNPTTSPSNNRYNTGSSNGNRFNSSPSRGNDRISMPSNTYRLTPSNGGSRGSMGGSRGGRR